jgi:hypothetical protein
MGGLPRRGGSGVSARRPRRHTSVSMENDGFPPRKAYS